MKKIFLAALILLAFTTSLFSQDKQKPITLDGYMTTLQSAMFDSLSGTVVFDNVLHNRLNFKGYLNKSITLAIEFRNRLFTGDMARTGNSYSDMIGKDQGWADMSWNLLNENSFFLNTSIDRMWVDFSYEKVQVRIGRQRINWGQTFVWNPNDIFNAYSFFDFDYTEKPGSDAIRIQYYPSFSSALELAVKVDSDDDITAAGLYRFNKWGYDIQLLAGYSNSSDIVAGAGWSGSIGSFSFRGEGSWFHKLNDYSDTSGIAILTAGIDKVFTNNSMIQIQVMYCNHPLELDSFSGFYNGNLSAKDLAFSRFSTFGQFSWAASPLLNIGVSAMWFPDLKGYFAGPSVDWSLAENIDMSVIWQHFNSVLGGIKTRVNLAFLRFKYSF
jgi:hypothetical protein